MSIIISLLQPALSSAKGSGAVFSMTLGGKKITPSGITFTDFEYMMIPNHERLMLTAAVNAGYAQVSSDSQIIVDVNDADSVTQLVAQAMGGDMVIDIDPTTDTTLVPTAAAWDYIVTLSLTNAAGDIHTWCNGAFAAILSVGDTGGGTATILPATVCTFVNGVCEVTVSGDAATWANAETVTLTVANITIMGYTVTGGTCVLTFTT